MEEMKTPVAAAPKDAKKKKHNYLIPVIIAFFAIGAFLIVLNFAI